MVTIVGQVYVFLYAVLGWAIVAFLYDILRIKRRAIKTNVIIVSLEDILYWLVSALVMFLIVYNSNNGEIRGFIFIGNIIGVALYLSLLSNIIITSAVTIINIIKKILNFIWTVISYPFKIIYRFLFKLIKFILRPVLKVLRYLKARISIPVKSTGTSIVHMIRKIGLKSKNLKKHGKNT